MTFVNQPKYSIYECAKKVWSKELQDGEIETGDMLDFDKYAAIYDWYDMETPKYYRDYSVKNDTKMSYQKWVEAIDLIMKKLEKEAAIEEEKHKLE